MEHNAVEQKPVFMPRVNSDNLVKTDMVRVERHVGFASRQKKKSINDLHQVIRKKYGFSNVLEMSSKSGNKLSFLLSPLSLQLTDEDSGGQYSVENIFQASKVFERGGPFTDLLTTAPRQAKKDERLHHSGQLIGYNDFGMEWGIEPLTVFYDWLYINALKQNTQLHDEVMQYQAFTDITFNPKKSIHCAAYSLAMFVALSKRELLDKVEDAGTFYDLHTEFTVSNTEQLLEKGWF
ncbi:DarT1-associated NADAR antitoxin family protein [Psychrobacter sp. DM8]|uniref:DarT1-associated NADAR antitoxin family protein n=1 Tax=unclassified Psychrobacter TaxID=196806 RepID=UPI003F50C387